jgi:hypothetical protein
MSLLRRGLLLPLALLLAALGGVTLWRNRTPDEPAYQGKRLSAWLDDLSALDYSRRADPGTEPARAVRAIGTNAIPWLMGDLTAQGSL